MKLGIYLNAQRPAGDDPARRFAETLEQARLIRGLGFDSVWGGEHHVTPGFHYFPLLPMLQRLASEVEGMWVVHQRSQSRAANPADTVRERRPCRSC